VGRGKEDGQEGDGERKVASCKSKGKRKYIKGEIVSKKDLQHNDLLLGSGLASCMHSSTPQEDFKITLRVREKEFVST